MKKEEGEALIRSIFQKPKEITQRIIDEDLKDNKGLLLQFAREGLRQFEEEIA